MQAATLRQQAALAEADYPTALLTSGASWECPRPRIASRRKTCPNGTSRRSEICWPRRRRRPAYAAGRADLRSARHHGRPRRRGVDSRGAGSGQGRQDAQPDDRPIYQRDDLGTIGVGFRAWSDVPVLNTGEPLVKQRFAELHARQAALDQAGARPAGGPSRAGSLRAGAPGWSPPADQSLWRKWRPRSVASKISTAPARPTCSGSLPPARPTCKAFAPARLAQRAGAGGRQRDGRHRFAAARRAAGRGPLKSSDETAGQCPNFATAGNSWGRDFGLFTLGAMLTFRPARACTQPSIGNFPRIMPPSWDPAVTSFAGNQRLLREAPLRATIPRQSTGSRANWPRNGAPIGSKQGAPQACSGPDWPDPHLREGRVTGYTLASSLLGRPAGKRAGWRQFT